MVSAKNTRNYLVYRFTGNAFRAGEGPSRAWIQRWYRRNETTVLHGPEMHPFREAPPWNLGTCDAKQGNVFHSNHGGISPQGFPSISPEAWSSPARPVKIAR
ncbi:hypothetical protein GF325_03350 [Candidatus Bathyarchaeota archaeon]|nr:hypothetical protein [Candidatus Bathyarchaeota archaeon]